jgi:4-aminobutyrate aminotransferase-like enzyme
LRGVRQICDHHGILLICDEVQSGFGRTGKWFAAEHFGIEPDIMTVAKGIASGMPLSGVFSRLDLMKKWAPGTHGGTYGGNAVATAAAVATIQAMRDEKMVENAHQRGAQLRAGLGHMQEKYPVIGDVRGAVNLRPMGQYHSLDTPISGQRKSNQPGIEHPGGFFTGSICILIYG